MSSASAPSVGKPFRLGGSTSHHQTTTAEYVWLKALCASAVVTASSRPVAFGRRSRIRSSTSAADGHASYRAAVQFGHEGSFRVTITTSTSDTLSTVSPSRVLSSLVVLACSCCTTPPAIVSFVTVIAASTRMLAAVTVSVMSAAETPDKPEARFSLKAV